MASRNLRSKLRRNFGVPDQPESPAEAEPKADAESPPSPMRQWLMRQKERRAAPAPGVAPDGTLGGGTEIENDCGRFWLRRERVSLEHRHGQRALAGVREVDFRTFAERQRELGDAELAHCLFLDTETTGLSGGAGTTVFMVGLGFVDGEELMLEQVFLRSFAEERAALRHVAQRLQEHPLQVTFVGKSFDRHRLAARMTLHRLEHAMLDPRHLDLFHVARRAWKHELPDTRLRTVEEHKLGFVRHDDLPGSEAPRAWLDWLRDGSGRVDRVMEHNRLDVLSLVALMGCLGTR